MTTEAQLQAQFEARREEWRRRAGNIPQRPEVRGPAQVGDVYLFTETSDYPVEWMVMTQDPQDAEKVLVIPLDDHPLLGSRDTALADGVRALRCGRGAWVDASACRSELRGERLEVGEIEAALRLRQEILQGKIAPSAMAREVDADPEYRLWLDELDAARAALPGNARRDDEEGSATTPSPQRVVDLASRREKKKEKLLRWSGWAVAAALVPVLLGSGWKIHDLHQEMQKRSLEPGLMNPAKLSPWTINAPQRASSAELIPINGPFLYLELIPSPEDDYLFWQFEIEGERTWMSEVEEQAGRWILTIPVEWSKEREVEIRVYGFDQERGDALDVWVIEGRRLVPQPDDSPGRDRR